MEVTGTTCDRRENPHKFCSEKEKLWKETEKDITSVFIGSCEGERLRKNKQKKVTLKKRGLFPRYNLNLRVPITGVLNIGSEDTEVRRS